MKTIMLSYMMYLLLIFGCKVDHPKDETDKEVGMKNPDSWYFEMNEEKRIQFFKQLSDVKLGDSVPHVIKLLGMPTYDRDMARKEKNEIIYRLLSYYVRKKDRMTANNNDEVVRLIFSPSGILIMIESNVQGYEYKKGELPPK